MGNMMFRGRVELVASPSYRIKTQLAWTEFNLSIYGQETFAMTSLKQQQNEYNISQLYLEL